MAAYLAPGVYVREEPSAVRPIAGVGTSTAAFIGVVPDSVAIPDHANPAFDPKKTADAANSPSVNTTFTLKAAAGEVRLCTTFSEFTLAFGDFSTDVGHRLLAHAVYGFFNNGGTRCFVIREKTDATIAAALDKLAAIDEIAIVCAPGLTTVAIRDAIVTHCATLEDRFAVLDIKEQLEKDGIFAGPEVDVKDVRPANTDLAATYIPWLQVFDPAVALADPTTNGLIWVPPSGHVAGIYARVDALRGVHKAPANEVVRGRSTCATRSPAPTRRGSTRRASTRSARSTATSACGARARSAATRTPT